MRKVILAAVAALSLGSVANAAEIYRLAGARAKVFKMVGIAMRAYFQCPGHNDGFLRASQKMMEGPGGGRAYIHFHQAETIRWMTGGADEFDSFTRERGLAQNCAILANSIKSN
jgi:hypothetical protein